MTLPPLVRYLIRRVFSMLLSLLVITAVLYALVMLTPVETRAELYFPKTGKRMTEQSYRNMMNAIIKRYHLNDPYPVQYVYWLGSLFEGSWGYSASLQEEVLPAILRRTPATAELALFTVLAFIPLGILSGVIAGSRRNRAPDLTFRLSAFIATSMPSFILALVLIAFFYVQMRWLAPERLGSAAGGLFNSSKFTQYTGFATVDGLLNGQPGVTFDALRHLVMPVFTLALAHWATLGRITRVTMIEELEKDYVLAARAHGVPARRVVWRHALKNAVAPAMTSSVLSSASLLTGVFVVEIIYSFKGVSMVAVRSFQGIPDAPAAMGFAIYSVVVVLVMMLLLDLVQAVVDPRIRGGV